VPVSVIVKAPERGAIQETNVMSKNERFNGEVPPFFLAGFACLACLPIIYLATRPVIWVLHVPWLEWLLLALFTTVPISVTGIVLYFSAWHRESPKFRRILSVILSSCLIFGVDLLFVGFMVIVGCLIVGLSRVMGGN
jgi:hypothetical protein